MADTNIDDLREKHKIYIGLVNSAHSFDQRAEAVALVQRTFDKMSDLASFRSDATRARDSVIVRLHKSCEAAESELADVKKERDQAQQQIAKLNAEINKNAGMVGHAASENKHLMENNPGYLRVKETLSDKDSQLVAAINKTDTGAAKIVT